MTKRLTAADSWFLYLETPAMHLHVAGVMIIDPSTAPEGLDPEVLREHLAARLHLLPMFRRRLVFVPFGLDHPVWIDDPDFDLDRHLHLRTVSGDEELRELLGRICSEPLDRDAPLWEMYFIEGMEDGRIALLIKIHHALIDGVSGMAFLADLLDLSPEVVPPEPPEEPWRPEPLPGALESLRDAVADRLSTPGRPLGAAVRTARSTFDILQAAARARRSGHAVAGPFDAPRAPFNASLTPRRSVAFGTIGLAEVKATRRTFGTTLNDVVLAACTGGLRRFMIRTGDLPDRPLCCAVTNRSTRCPTCSCTSLCSWRIRWRSCGPSNGARRERRSCRPPPLPR